MSAYTEYLRAQAEALRAWAAATDVLAAQYEERAAATKAPKTSKPAIPEHDYTSFTLTAGMLSLLRPKRSSAGAEICRHCGLVRTLSTPYRFWDERGWRHTRPGCVLKGES